MIMIPDALPSFKGSLPKNRLSSSTGLLATRMVAAFLFHSGRMSCLQAAGAVESQPVHRSQMTRFLCRPGWRKLNLNAVLRQKLLEKEPQDGLFLFLIDQTLCGQQGKRTHNTYSTGNREKRPRQGVRYGKYKHARKSCHAFTFGLLITPSGMRIPFCKPYYTREYCREKHRPHQTTAEATADLIRALPLPKGARNSNPRWDSTSTALRISRRWKGGRSWRS